MPFLENISARSIRVKQLEETSAIHRIKSKSNSSNLVIETTTYFLEGKIKETVICGRIRL